MSEAFPPNRESGGKPPTRPPHTPTPTKVNIANVNADGKNRHMDEHGNPKVRR